MIDTDLSPECIVGLPLSGLSDIWALGMRATFDKGARPNNGSFVAFDYVKFIVGNAKQAAFWYCANFGFVPFMYRGLETGERTVASHVIRQNKIVFIFESALLPGNHELGTHLVQHGDGVKDVCFEVDDLDTIVAQAKKAGAFVVKGITKEEDECGYVRYAAIKTFGDTVHTLLERKNYRGLFLPGYKPHPQSKEFLESLPRVGLNFIDHCVGNQEQHKMESTVRFWSIDDSVIHTKFSGLRSVSVTNWEENIMLNINEAANKKGISQIQTLFTLCLREKNSKGIFLPGYKPHPQLKKFVESLPIIFWSIDDSVIHTEFSGLRSVSVTNWEENIMLNINEAANKKGISQIQEFVDYFGEAGVQHIALNTSDIINAVDDSVIHTEFSGLRSVSVTNWEENIMLNINEAANKKGISQIQEFVDYFGEAGVQHIALNTSDIINAIESMRNRGCQFLTIPETYYGNLRERLEKSKIKIAEDLDKLQKLHILVDFDENGYLLQIFSKPCQDKPTFFLEVIQRQNHKGFGAGNFKALFDSIELEQRERGNLNYENVESGKNKE